MKKAGILDFEGRITALVSKMGINIQKRHEKYHFLALLRVFLESF